ncbi:MAG: hypothetical protein ACTHZX_02990 [Microbacterium sp.]
MRPSVNSLNAGRKRSIVLGAIAIAALCGSLIPVQAAIAAPVDEPVPSDTATPTPDPTDGVAEDGGELAPTDEPVDGEGDPSAPDAEDEAPAGDDADAVVPEDEADAEDDQGAEDGEYLSPLNGDYAGGGAENEADPGDYSATLEGGAKARSLVGFRAGNLISDAKLYTSGTMSVSEIQSFLNGKVSSCRSGYTCLKDFRQTTTTQPANAYCSGTYSGASNETAAQIISKVSKACNVSEKVLLVMLQKEQGLITHVWPSRIRYDRAMGFACPDSGPGNSANCDSAYAGFGYQMYMAARQLQRYTKDSYFSWFPVGKTSQIQWHPNAGCGTGPVHIENNATAALYYYTPYQPNQAALSAGYGTGNGCSTYGNRNFYNYYTDWFGSVRPTDPCTVPSSVGKASRQYVTTSGVNARKAPSTSCGSDVFMLQAGTILHATRVTADGKWIELSTFEGRRWVSRDYLRYADAAEGACTVPAGTSAASRDYVVRADTRVKIGPWAACTKSSSVLSKGTVVKATRVSATGRWLQVRTQSGERWIPRSAVGYATNADVNAACKDPAGTSGAKLTYVVRSGTQGWVKPLPKCAARTTTFSQGTVLQATRVSASGKWLEVSSQGGTRWVARSAVGVASDSDISAACVQPSGTKGATAAYIVTSATKGWTSPLRKCGTGTRSVGSGTVVQATKVSASGSWLQIRTGVGNRWIPRSAVAVCTDPAGTKPASRQYVLDSAAKVVVSPLAQCGSSSKNWGSGTSPQTVKAGTVVQATRISSSGNWLEIKTRDGARWVKSSAVSVCQAPAGTKPASKRYVATKRTEGLVSPLAVCGTAAKHWGTGTGPRTIGVGTAVQATRVSASGKWLQVSTGVGPRWVWRADLRLQ